jgi:hypothetical protein
MADVQASDVMENLNQLTSDHENFYAEQLPTTTNKTLYVKNLKYERWGRLNI